MEIGSSNNISFSITDAIKKAPAKPSQDKTQNEIKPDSASISKIINQKAPEKKGNEALSGFGERLFNQPVLNHYTSFRKDATYLPVITKIDQAVQQGAGIKDLEKIAVNAVKTSNNKLSPSDTLTIAYRAILASVIPNHYSDPNFFNGEKDKIFHYFTSASLTLEAYNYMPVAPSAVKSFLAGKSVLTVGWLKEVGSIPGNGYGADDMQANKMGINAAIDNLNKLRKNKSL